MAATLTNLPPPTAPNRHIKGARSASDGSPYAATGHRRAPIPPHLHPALAVLLARDFGGPSLAFRARQGELAGEWSGQLAYSNDEESWAERLREATRHGQQWGTRISCAKSASWRDET